MISNDINDIQDNDIQDNIQSTIKLFADDCVIYREICKEDDHQALQRDLQCLSTWSSDCQGVECFYVAVTGYMGSQL